MVIKISTYAHWTLVMANASDVKYFNVNQWNADEEMGLKEICGERFNKSEWMQLQDKCQKLSLGRGFLCVGVVRTWKLHAFFVNNFGKWMF